MTWVIAIPTTFGYSAAMADIQVTFSDGQSLDCLQKIYPISNDFCAGFSGSVKIGFSLLKSLKVNFPYCGKGSAWIPGYVARTWQPIAKKIFNESEVCEKECGSSILIIASHPRETTGLPGVARNYAIKLLAPDFKPIFEKADKLLSIGSGTDHYKDEILNFNKELPFELVQMEIGKRFGYGEVLMRHLTDSSAQNPQKGISKHFHMAFVTIGKYLIISNDQEIYHADGRIERIVMPSVVKNYHDFLQYCRDSKRAVTSAIA